MNLTCPSCSAPIEVDLSRVPTDGFTVRCPQCAHSFLYFPPKGASAPAPSAPISAGSGRANALNTRYFIKRPTGKIFGPFDSNAIRAMLNAGKLSVAAEVSPDQTVWQRLADVEAFADLVAQLAGQDGAPAPNQGFARPTPGGTMMGAWVDSEQSEGSDSSEPPSLPRLAPPQLPRPQRTSDAPELPRLPSRLPGLPIPRAAGEDKPSLPGARPGLPKPRGAGGPPDLPGVAHSLPAPASGLPQRKAHDDLPQPHTHGLPGTRPGDALPRSRSQDLPGTMDDMNLPAAPTREVESWTQNNDLFGDSALDDDLFGDSDHDADLFDDPGLSDALFDDAPQDHDLFDGPGNDDTLFDSAPQDDDLFGAPGPSDDDLFGGPSTDDDLFDAPLEAQDDFGFNDPPAQHHASLEDDAAGFDMGGARSADAFGGDDLFDAPDDDADEDLFAAPGFVEDDQDLFEPDGLDFGESSGALDEGDDFLSDDDNFTFLDEPSQPAQDDLAGMSGEWGDDLMSDAPVMDAFDSGRHDDGEDWEQDAWDSGTSAPAGAPPRAAHSPESNAPGSRQPASRGISAQTSRDEAVEADKKRGAMTTIGVSLLGVVLVGGLAYGVYNSFFSAETEPQEVTVVKEAAPTRVELNGIESDTYGDLRAFIDRARKGKLGAEDTAKLLLAESILLARYDDSDVRKHAASLAQPLAEASSGWDALARGAFEAQNANADAARSYLEPLLGEDEELAYYAQLMMGVGDALAVEKKRDETPPPAAEKADAQQKSGAEPQNADEADDKERAQKDSEKPADAPISDALKRIAARGVSALDDAQKARPDAPAPKYWRARLQAQTARPDAAIESWQAALKTSKSHVASSVKLGEALYLRGDLNNASTELSRVIDEFEALAAPAERADALHLQGIIHVARQESEEAIKALTTALSIDVGRSDTIQVLAEQYMSAEKYQEALNFFTTNKNLGAENPDVMLGIVRAYMGLEKWDDATEQLQRGAKLFPEDARFPLYLGRLHRDRLAYFDAQKVLSQALKIDPSLLSAHAALAQLIWITDKDRDAAQQHIDAVEAQSAPVTAAVGTEVAKYYEMSEQRDLAEQRYEQTLRHHPNYWPARLALARMYLDSQENEKALALLERARDEGVKDLRLSAYLADAYRQSRHFAKAVDQINAVIAEHADNPQYIFIRGRIYFDQGNFDTAREDFIRAYELDTRFHQAYFYLGRTAFAQDDFSMALKIFRHVLDYTPNNGEFHYWMGRAYEAENRLTSALDEYRKATVVDEAFGAKNPELFVRRGELLSKLGYSKKGKEDIAQALRIAPDMTEALVAMGNSNYRDKEYDEAIANFRNALKLDAQLAEVQYKLGMALMYTGRETKGAEHLQLAVRHGYDDPEVFQTLGYLYKRMNRKKAAIDSFKKYLALIADKKTVTASAKREMIQQIEELGGHL